MALALALTIGACARPGEEGSRTAPAESPAPRAAPIAGSGLAPPVSGDAQALGVLQALDENEIQLAQQAVDRRVGGATEQFAQAMVQRHQASLASTRALSPQLSEQSRAVRARGEASVAALKMEDEENPYRNAFLALAAADYADALRVIDAELLPAAQTEAVRAHLQEARRRYATGYEQAQSAASTR